jgi:tetratricopeptide (TPR) repeat protein
MSILPYTPGNMGYAELRTCFVARQPLLDELLGTLAAQARAETLQHWMLLGERGMGKTHLLRLYRHEIARNSGLVSGWLPVLMNEEEPEVFNLATFFIRVLIKTAEALVEEGESFGAARITAFVESLRDQVLTPARIADRAAAFLRDFSKEISRRLVVLLENADDLFTKCLPKAADQQKLRKILSAESFLLLIAASPTFFSGISEEKGVFYDFFRLRRLEPLTFFQARDLLLLWAREEQDTAREQAFHGADSRLKVLFHLTGGIPRLLYFLYRAVTGENSLENAVQTFETLLEEDLTAYYQARLRDIPNSVQPIVLALAKSPRNLTSKEIARETFLPERSLGAQIGRLEEAGVVRAVSGKKGKNTVYGITDYLFRVWCQWRFGKQTQVIAGLVEFLAVWFRKDELETLCVNQGLAGEYYRAALRFKKDKGFRPLLDAVLQDEAESFKELCSKGDYAAAASLFKKMECYADNRETVRRKFLGPLQKKGDLAGLEAFFRHMVELDPEDQDSRRWFGLVCLGIGNSKGDEDAFRKVVDLAPEDANSWFLLGTICRIQKDYAGAEDAFQKAADLVPDDSNSWKRLGDARMNQENYAGAEIAFQKAVDLVPDDSNSWKRLGDARMNQENYAGAEIAFQKAVDLVPDDAYSWNLLGTAYIGQNNYARAEDAFQQAVELAPDEADSWFWLGFARLDLENYSGAEEALQNAVELAPDDADSWFWLGFARLDLENHTGAEEALQKAVELVPDNADSWYWLGFARQDQENHAGAEQAFQRTAELNPENADSWEGLGQVRLEQENYNGSVAAYQKAVEIAPDNSGYRDALGWALFRAGRVEDALRELAVCLEKDPEFAEAYLDVTIVFMLAGRPENLPQTLEQAVSSPSAAKDLQALLSLLASLVLSRAGETRASETRLSQALALLGDLPQDARRKVLDDLTRCLTMTLGTETLDTVEAFLARFQNSTEDPALFSIVRPLGHVLEYARACATEAAGPASRKAQTALDRVPGELREPVLKLCETVRENLEWQRRVLKKSW